MFSLSVFISTHLILCPRFRVPATSTSQAVLRIQYFSVSSYWEPEWSENICLTHVCWGPSFSRQFEHNIPKCFIELSSLDHLSVETHPSLRHTYLMKISWKPHGVLLRLSSRRTSCRSTGRHALGSDPVSLNWCTLLLASTVHCVQASFVQPILCRIAGKASRLRQAGVRGAGAPEIIVNHYLLSQVPETPPPPEDDLVHSQFLSVTAFISRPTHTLMMSRARTTKYGLAALPVGHFLWLWSASIAHPLTSFIFLQPGTARLFFSQLQVSPCIMYASSSSHWERIEFFFVTGFYDGQAHTWAFPQSRHTLLPTTPTSKQKRLILMWF